MKSEIVPKVSILMPAYNVQDYVAQAIESMLCQTFRDFEFIIIDDGSIDNSWDIIQEYAKKDDRIVALKNEANYKICKTLNRGIDIARGKYLVRMDADDWSYPYRLEKQVKFMDKNPEIGVSGGRIMVCDKDMRCMHIREYKLNDKEIRKRMFFYNPFCHPATIWRSDILKNSSCFNEMLYDVEDYDLYFRMGRMSKFANLPDILVKYRISENSVSSVRAHRQERLTLYVRLKAIIEYGYRMDLKSMLYLGGQYISMFIMPYKFKVWLFNQFR